MSAICVSEASSVVPVRIESQPGQLGTAGGPVATGPAVPGTVELLSLPTTTNRWVSVTESEGKPCKTGEIEFHGDWFNFTFFGCSVDRVVDLFSAIVLDRSPEDDAWAGFEEREGGTQFYKRLWNGHAITIQDGAKSDAVRPHVIVQLRGEACDLYELHRIVDWAKAVGEGCEEVRCTRLDVAWDYVSFTPADCYQALQAGCVRTRAQTFEYIQCGRVKSKLRNASSRTAARVSRDLGVDVSDVKEGETFYLGRHSSARELCVYNYRRDSQGNRFTRAEFRMRGDYANCVWDFLKNEPLPDWSKFCMRLLVDFVSFVDASADSNISRCESDRLPFWSDFVGSASRHSLRIPADAVPLPCVRVAHERRRRAMFELARQFLSFGEDVVLADLRVTTGKLLERDHRRAAALTAHVRQLAEKDFAAAYGSCYWQFEIPRRLGRAQQVADEITAREEAPF